MNAGQVTALSRIPSVTRVELDGLTQAVDAAGEQDYGVDLARGDIGAADGALDGGGVGICIIDTGIDPDHEQFTGSRVVAWQDWVNGLSTPYDDHGHGTHVAGIAAGDSSGGTDATRYGGVAGAAHLAIAKVLSSSGSGADSDVVSAIQWCAGLPGVDVISMSLGSPGGDGSDAGSQAVDAATTAGVTVVVAAGNSGDAPGTISSPGVATGAITVGAASDPSTLSGGLDTDAGLYLAGFSGRGPTTNPAAPLKPDIVAPGLSVGAAEAGTAASYVAYSGTSMATPFVAGVVALALEAAPATSPAQVKAALQATARDAGTPGPDNDWGHGLIDARAFLAAVTGGAAGTAPWPDQASVTGEVASGATKDFTFEVAAAGAPLGVTLETTNGAATCVLPFGNACWYGYEWSPDLDAYLISPAGAVVAESRCMLTASNGNCAAPGRFETLSLDDAAAGTWTLRVESFSGAGTFAATVFGALDGGAPPPPPPPPPPDPTLPDAPSSLQATATSDTEADLAWNDNSGDETGFEIERCTDEGCSGFAKVAEVGADTTAWSDDGLTANTTYRYRVRAVNEAVASSYSNEAGTTTQPAPPPPPEPTPPAAPSDLTATAISSTLIELTWLDNSGNETGFEIEQCSRNCQSFTTVATVGANVTSWSDTGVKKNTDYGYRVRAVNDDGPSAYSNTAEDSTPRR